MISGGLVAGGSSKSLKKTYAREVNSVHSWFPPLKTLRYYKPDIIFFEKDAHGLDSPIIMLRMEEFNMHLVLVNNGSLADIIYLPAFQQMKLNKERHLSSTSLQGDQFSRSRLPINIQRHPWMTNAQKIESGNINLLHKG